MRAQRYFIWVLPFLFTVFQGYSQWSHDFVADPLWMWSGDTDHFRVTDGEWLQLDAPQAGQSFIYRDSKIDFDTITISIRHLMEFAPSANNKSIIYLALDDPDPQSASGYYIEIGENGSGDALKFYYLNKGQPELIAQGSMGAMASAPAMVNIILDIFPSGMWVVKTDYSAGDSPMTELEFLENRFDWSQSLYFGIRCKYTTSRKDKFFYDDLAVLPFEVDRTPPSVSSVKASSPNILTVEFSEALDMVSALDRQHYKVNNGIGGPSQVTFAAGSSNTVLLQFDMDFDPSLDYSLNIEEVMDVNGNTMEASSWPFVYIGPPDKGDLLISEILFNPYPGEEDFLEIYNPTNHPIDLTGCTIRNDYRDISKTLQEGIIPSKSYLAISQDTQSLIMRYKPDPGAIFQKFNLPPFNNEQGNAMLISPSGVVIDSMNYDQEMHFSLIDDPEGVSLERLSFDVPATQKDNWHSAAKSTRYATPGYQNSNLIPISNGEDRFFWVRKTFSPNQDGVDDIMVLGYMLDKPGYVANFKVFDVAGNQIKVLASNELLGTTGNIIWDGLDDNGSRAAIGHYILSGEIFHPQGEVIHVKKVVTLVDFLK